MTGLCFPCSCILYLFIYVGDRSEMTSIKVYIYLINGRQQLLDTAMTKSEVRALIQNCPLTWKRRNECSKVQKFKIFVLPHFTGLYRIHIWKINNVAMRKHEAYWFLIMKQILDSGIWQNNRWQLDYISTCLVHSGALQQLMVQEHESNNYLYNLPYRL